MKRVIKSSVSTIILVSLMLGTSCGSNTVSPNGSSNGTQTTDATLWTPLKTLIPVTLPGSIILPGGIKVFPSVPSPWPDLPVLTDIYKYVEISVGTEFCIGIDADFSLGNSWNLTYDENRLFQVATDTKYFDASSGRLGTLWFRFKADAQGFAVITLDLIPGSPDPTESSSPIIHLPFVVQIIE